MAKRADAGDFLQMQKPRHETYCLLVSGPSIACLGRFATRL